MSTHFQRPPLNVSLPALLAAVEDSFSSQDLFYIAQALENPPPNNNDENNENSNDNNNESGEDDDISAEDIEDLEATAAGSGSTSGFSPPIDVGFGGNSGNVGSQSQTTSYSNENNSPGSDEEPFFEEVDNPPRPQNDGFNDEFMVNEAGLWTEGANGSDVDCLYGSDKQSKGEFNQQLDSCSECSICDGREDLSATMTTGNVLLNDDLGTDPAGIIRVAFNGINYTPDENGVITVATPLGELILYTRAFDDNIAGNFKYTLFDNGQHPDGDGNNKLFEDFLYTLSDAEGDSGSAFLRITIIDDVPCAKNEPCISVVESDEPINGNVLSNDIHGADGPGRVIEFSYNSGQNSTTVDEGDSTTVITALGGTLTVYSNGDWDYTPPLFVDNRDDPVLDSFSYTMTDTDGDTSSAEQKIEILDGPDPVPMDDGRGDDENRYKVFESGLSDGSDPDSSDLTTTGNVLDNDIFGPDPASITSINYASQEFAPDEDGVITVDTPYGTLTLYAVNFDGHLAGDFSYELNANAAHDVDKNIFFEDFTYTLEDFEGDANTARLRIRIDDDEPKAINDEAVVVKEGSSQITGNVLENDNLGADKPALVSSFSYDDDSETALVPSGSSTTVTTALGGILTVFSNGDWEYTPPDSVDNTDGRVPDHFTYTITDDDGDADSAKQRIRISDGPNPEAINDEPVNIEEGSSMITGNVLDNDIEGSDTPLRVTSFTYDDDTLMVNIIDGGFASVTTAQGGTLIVSSNGDWQYTPPNLIDNSSGDVPDHFTYTITDTDGDTDSAQQQLFIEDGLGPDASDDGFMISSDPFDQLYIVYESGLTGGSGELPDDTVTQGNVLVNDTDGNEPASITQIEFDSVLYTPDTDGIISIDTPGGSLNLFTEDFDIYSAGDFQYLLDAALDQTGTPDDTVFEDFEYTLEDSDGSSNIATLRVGIVEDPLPPLPDIA